MNEKKKISDEELRFGMAIAKQIIEDSKKERRLRPDAVSIQSAHILSRIILDLTERLGIDFENLPHFELE